MRISDRLTVLTLHLRIVQKIILIFCLSIVFCFSGEAQDKSLDSLRSILGNLEYGSDTFITESQKLAYAFHPRYPDSTEKYSRAAVFYFWSKESSLSKFNCFFQHARLMARTGKVDEGLHYIQECIAMATEQNLKEQVARARLMHAYLLSSSGKYEESIKANLLAFDELEELKDSSRMGTCLVNIGYSHFSIGNSSEAIRFYKQGAEILGQFKDYKNLGTAINNLAFMSQVQGDTLKAIIYYEQSLALADRSANPRTSIRPLSNLALIYTAMGRKAQSSYYSQELRSRVRQFPYLAGRVAVASTFSQYFETFGPLDSARAAYKELYTLTKTLGNPREMLATLDSYQKFEITQGDTGSAYVLLSEYKRIDDTLLSADKSSLMQELTMQFEKEKAEAENALLKEKQDRILSREKTIFRFGALFAGMFILIVVLMWRASQRRKRLNADLDHKRKTILEQNEQLFKANDNLVKLNEEKDALMGIVAHDLKAPLSKVSGLVTLLEMFREDPEKFEESRKMIERVISSGNELIEELILLNQLENSGQEVELEASSIHKIVRQSVDTFAAKAQSKGIAIHFEPDSSKILAPTHTPYLVRVLDNLISNAVKFSPQGKRVFVRLTQVEDAFEIGVRDEGPGIAKSEQGQLFDKFCKLSARPTAGESSSGLGLSIVKKLTELLGGSVSVISEVGKGAEFVVRFPMNP